jgi:hypothetical protein|tara:strand:+ start:1038 stop:1385 length:348 start_codon:yes stop_codon:yes gene_type:complete
MKDEHVLELVEKIGGDGWTIFRADAEMFSNLTDEIRERVTRVHKSDGSPKGSLWDDDGGIIPELLGIYALDLMWVLAEEVKADTTIAASKMGRGFASRALADAIVEKLAPEKGEA